MAANNYENCLDLVLKSEGGWVDGDKIGDPGGETNLGVTKRVWEEYVGHPVTTMKNLTKADVAPMYEQKYWRPTYGEVLPAGIDFLCFSMGVNAGPGRAVKLLQSAIGCVPDGVIGPTTMGLIRASNAASIINKFSESRRGYYRSLNKPQFEHGWLSRVDNEEKEALNMCKNA